MKPIKHGWFMFSERVPPPSTCRLTRLQRKQGEGVKLRLSMGVIADAWGKSTDSGVGGKRHLTTRGVQPAVSGYRCMRTDAFPSNPSASLTEDYSIDQTNFGGSHIKLRVHASARKSLNIDINKTFAIDFKLFYYIL